MGDVENRLPEISGLVTIAVLDTKNGEFENKIQDTSKLVNTTLLNTKIGEVEKDSKSQDSKL